MDSIFSTLKKIKDVFISEEEDEGEEEVPRDENMKLTPRTQRKGDRRGGKHNGKHEDAPTEIEDKKVRKAVSQTYTKTNAKENTLLAISKNDSDTGPNSEVGRRVRSMKIAHSMNSVYRKINKDKNVHTDRHYLVAVAEQIKEESGQKGT